jgi:hypothetical protein
MVPYFMDSVENVIPSRSVMRNNDIDFMSDKYGCEKYGCEKYGSEKYGSENGGYVSDHNVGVSVDLRLASSYLPGIFSVCKVVMLLAALNIMQKLGVRMEQAIIVCAACLYLDRCLSIRYIMDTGACSLCVLISVGVNSSRVSLDGEPGVGSVICALVWAAVSVLILYDVHRPLIRYTQTPGIVHVLTSSFCVLYGFLTLDLEIDAIAYTRAIAFAVLCVVWVYTLSLGGLRETFNDSFSSCVDRFAMVLVADIYVTSGYVLFAIVSIGWQYRSSLLQQQTSPPVGVVMTETVWGSSGLKNSASMCDDIAKPDDIDVHTAFRLAQENARKGVHAR